MSSRPPRALAAVLAAWGAVQLAFPAQVLAAVAPHRPQPPTWAVQLLGGRMVVQYAGVAAAPDRRVVLLSAGVDGLHAASMLLVAAVRPDSRRVCLASAGVAGAAAVAGLLAAPR